jgi:hypothetical protein
VRNRSRGQGLGEQKLLICGGVHSQIFAFDVALCSTALLIGWTLTNLKLRPNSNASATVVSSSATGLEFQEHSIMVIHPRRD